MNGWMALSPLAIFLATYLVTSLISRDFYKVPVASAFLLASIYAVLITPGKIQDRIGIFSSGAGDKNVLLIAASTTTGHTIKRAIDCVDYYGGTVVGAASIFSAVNKIFDVPIYSIFNLSDVPDYGTYKHENCPMCKARQKVDAIANGFGYSVLP